jgi:hypothetical protein
MVEEVPLTAIAVIVGAASALVSTATIYYRKKQYEIAKKQYDLTALFEVFQVLNNESHRMARQAVYRRHRDIMDGKSVEQDTSQQMAMVRSDFDMIGVFVRNDLLSKEVFLNAYWDTTLVCWNALKDNIAEERKIRGNQNYMANFEYLASEAKLYKEKYLPSESIRPY